MHHFKYKIKVLLHTKEELFWSFLFPLILATLFYVSFGKYMDDSNEFKPIPVAIVDNKDVDNTYFKALIHDLSSSKEGKLLDSDYMTEKEAKEKLLDKKVSGIIYMDKKIRLSITESSLNQNILKCILDQFIQYQSVITQVSKENPEKIPALIKDLSTEIRYNKEVSYNKGGKNSLLNYFYSLIAMSCLYGCFFGLNSATSMQANLTALGARRCIAPSNKLKMIFADFCATVLLQFISVVVLLGYLLLILKIDFGNNIPYVFLTAFIGSLIGVANGIFIGSIGKMALNIKSAVLITFTMLCCFLSGLMYANMKGIVEENAPFINRINPAALLSDAFYCLCIYDNYEKYWKISATLVVMAISLCVGSFLLIRREKYASI